MDIAQNRIVTVFNAKGLEYMNAAEYYSKSSRIKAIEAVIYDGSGNEIKKFKRRDFKESAVSDGSIITDNRLLYLDYTPVQYPFTVVFTSETETSATAFIPPWYPQEGTYVSCEKSVRNITYKPELGFKYKEYNFAGVNMAKQEQPGKLSLSVENLPAVKNEDHSPAYHKMVPHILFGLEKFHLEGVDGQAETWAAFGAWTYNSLLEGTDVLLPETQEKIKKLTAGETDILKKAKIIYKYVQDKTRYISIQLGIGGWKPMAAKDVDRLGYGDCKALTNYTRALLKTVGIDSYYTIVYGDSSKRDLRPDFVSMQGNHVILAIPVNNTITWLECTSQTIPFGYQGDMTDDRLALMVKPGGGELVRTTFYDKETNSQFSTGNYTISGSGAVAGNVKISSKGLQYDNKYFLENKSAQEIQEFYKSGFRCINNIKVKKAGFTNNKENPEFTEDISFEAEGYCNNSGNKYIFAVNAFNQYSRVPQRYRNRKNAFEIRTGFYDVDEITIALPDGYAIEAQPEDIIITDKFGEYRAQYIMASPQQMIFKRSLLIKDGNYESKDYESYRQFIEKISRNDNAKVVLVKN